MFLHVLFLEPLLVASCLAAINGNLISNHFGIPGRNVSFDYVVVGGGTAGLAIATRLAEDGSNSVAVVEAGGQYDIDNGNTSVVPYLGAAYDDSDASTVDAFPQVDWEILTTPQVAASGKRVHYTRGRTLGGSSALNNIVYQRGTVQSYQQWADLVGDPSYTFPSLLPYFRKAVRFTPPDMMKRPSNSSVPPSGAEAYSKDGGPLTVSFQNFPISVDSWIKRAFEEIGLKQIKDFVTGKLIGHQYTPLETNPLTQNRASSYSTYLTSSIARGDTNLQVYPRTLAKKVMFERNTAKGVEVMSYGKTFTLSASKEVILSAGAFQSPQVLMVSGIGPAATLKKHGIKVISDLAGVGQNMWDHVLFGLSVKVNLQGAGSLNDPAYNAQATQSYLQNATGILTSAGFDYIGWEKLPKDYRSNFTNRAENDLTSFPPDWPEIEYVTGDGSMPPTADSILTFLATLVAPTSRGNVTITSADTQDLPVVNPNWLSNPTDIEVAVAAFKRAREILGAKAFQPITLGPVQPIEEQVSTDEQIRSFVRQTASTLYHASCTCAMGKQDDPMAVIDSRARVYGVKRLRVVDASSFPLLPPGHPTATIYALAEKMADDILTNRA